MATWRDNTLAKTLATLAGATRIRVITDPTGTPVSQQTTVDALRAYICREKLTANRTYYVRTDGSDSNDGLANTSGGAFLTIAKALSVAYYEIDAQSYTITIQVADGTYAEAISLLTSSPNNVTLRGNTTTPANCIIAPGGSTTAVTVSAFLRILIDGFETQTTGTHLYAFNAGTINFQNHRFGGGTCTSHMQCQGNQAAIIATGNYTVTTSAGRHFYAIEGGNIRCVSRTITLTGTPAFSTAYASADRASRIFANGCTFSGSATGTKYSSLQNSVIYTNGAGASYFPGTAATGTTGTVDVNDGQYI